DRAAVRLDHAQAHQQGGGLAGAVGPEQGDPLAPAHGQVDAVDGPAAAVRLLEAAGAEDVAHGSQCPSRPRRPATGYPQLVRSPGPREDALMPEGFGEPQEVPR